ncbi:hypothetical protein D7B12_18105 [Salmonella enterica]|nr:hypothetical protein [Salmonella enterica]
MTSHFVRMLIQKADEQAAVDASALPVLTEAELRSLPQLEVRRNNGVTTFLVTVEGQHYSRVNDEYFIRIQARHYDKESVYWRKLNAATNNIMQKIDEIINNGRKNA